MSRAVLSNLGDTGPMSEIADLKHLLNGGIVGVLFIPELCEFKLCLVYIICSRSARTTILTQRETSKTKSKSPC